jgi:hypothetical protein
VERPKDLDAADLTGTEGITLEDTGEADFGRLLERAYEKSHVRGIASPDRLAPTNANNDVSGLASPTGTPSLHNIPLEGEAQLMRVA